MSDVIRAVQNSIEIVKRLRELNQKVQDAEFKGLLADLSSELSDAKLESANLKSQLATLQEENQNLAAQLEQKTSGSPEIKDGLYEFPGEEGQFCTACFDARGKKVRVKKLTGAFTAFGQWSCPVCDATYG